MKNKQIKFLKRIVETPSPTGFEVPVAKLVREQLAAAADEIKTDTMGSVHATYYGSVHHRNDADNSHMASVQFNSVAGVANAVDTAKHALTLMLAAHMDEIGLMVTYISEDGFLSVAAIGGVDAAILPGMRVDVHTDKGPLRGVVGRKPIHLIDSDDRKTVTPLDKLVIDLGMSAKQVRKRVKVGDPITFGVGFERFGHDMVVSRALDDKIGVFITCRVMENLAADISYTGNFVGAITVQEEIGTRGAMTSAHSVQPDVALAFDVTHATDYPGIDKSKYGDIACGKGPVIARGPNINPVVFDRLVKAADDEGIAYQLEAEPSVTGTDARAIQVTREGIPTGLVSIPLRYMHTPTEVISLSDVDGAIRLITRFARDLDSSSSFVPGYAEHYVSKASLLVSSDSHDASSALDPDDEVDEEDELDELDDVIDDEVASDEAVDAIADDSQDVEAGVSSPLTPEEAPFGRQQESLSAEFNALDLNTKTIGAYNSQVQSIQQPETYQGGYPQGFAASQQRPAYPNVSQQGIPRQNTSQQSMSQQVASQQATQHVEGHQLATPSTSSQAQQSRKGLFRGQRRNPNLTAVPIVTLDATDDEDTGE